MRVFNQFLPLLSEHTTAETIITIYLLVGAENYNNLRIYYKVYELAFAVKIIITQRRRKGRRCVRRK